MQNAGRARVSQSVRPGSADGQASGGVSCDVGGAWAPYVPYASYALSPILNRRGSGWGDFGPNQRS